MSLRPFWVLPVLALLFGCTPNVGNKCSLSTDCSQLGDRLCDTNQPDGYCTVFNCEPDTCPTSICVAFDPTLDPACGSADNGRWPRFERTFCLAPCSSNSDCRDQYDCVDLSVPANQIARSAQVVDLGAADGGLGFSVCMAATCGDGIKDGAETGVDCGGPDCKQCNNRQQCSSGTDCVSGLCVNGTCVGPTCTDNALDGTETDVDCGGTDCVACSAGKICLDGADCTNGFCLATASSSTCQPGNCIDGQKNGLETDVDCGGSVCSPCATRQMCSVASDCTTETCSGPTCSTGKTCKVDSDCPGATAPCTTRCAIPPICFVPDAGAPWTPYVPDAGGGGGAGGAPADGGAGGAPADGGAGGAPADGGAGGAPSDGGTGGAPSDGGPVGDAGDAG